MFIYLPISVFVEKLLKDKPFDVLTYSKKYFADLMKNDDFDL